MASSLRSFSHSPETWPPGPSSSQCVPLKVLQMLSTGEGCGLQADNLDTVSRRPSLSYERMLLRGKNVRWTQLFQINFVWESKGKGISKQGQGLCQSCSSKIEMDNWLPGEGPAGKCNPVQGHEPALAPPLGRWEGKAGFLSRDKQRVCAPGINKTSGTWHGL